MRTPGFNADIAVNRRSGQHFAGLGNVRPLVEDTVVPASCGTALAAEVAACGVAAGFGGANPFADIGCGVAVVHAMHECGTW